MLTYCIRQETKREDNLNGSLKINFFFSNKLFDKVSLGLCTLFYMICRSIL
jgi:hypothetical protein